MNNIDLNNYKLFEFVYDTVIYGAGGDGDGMVQIKSQLLEQVVEEFKFFLTNKDEDTVWDITYHDNGNLILFSHHHESIGFCNSKYDFDDKGCEVVVRTW